MLHEGQNERLPAIILFKSIRDKRRDKFTRVTVERRVVTSAIPTWRKMHPRRFIIVHCKSLLLRLIHAFRPSSCLAYGLDRW